MVLFGAVGLVGVLGYGTTQYIKGPLTTATNVTRVNLAETQMMIASQVAVVTSAQQALSGDCDADGYIEPLRYRNAGTNPKPVGGGYIPTEVGGTTEDPWGTEYGYCVWDHGTQTLQNSCKNAGNDYRLAGGNIANQPVVAIVTAGKDKTFQTTCRAWVDANADLQPDQPLIEKTSGSDDVIIKYTYAEATGMGGGLWALKSGDPATATITKDLEVTGGAQLSGNLTFASGGLILPDQTTSGACAAGTANQMRRNTTGSPPSLEICVNDGSPAWEAVTAGGGGGGTPGGNDTEVQFNDGGAFNGDTMLVWDKTNNQLGVGSTTTHANLDLGSGTGQKLLSFADGSNGRSGLGANMGASSSYQTNLFGQNDGTAGNLSFGFVATSDGTTYTERMRLLQNGRLGIGVTAPDAMLEVNGEIILGDSSLACAAGTEGGIKYDTTSNTIKFCDGAGTWANVDGSGGGGGSGVAGSSGYIQYNDAGSPGAESAFIWDKTNDRMGIGRATPVAAIDINGSFKVADDATACSATINGAIRFDTTNNILQYCNGTSWITPLNAPEANQPYLANSATGYFVLTETTYTGNLGQLFGANTKCLTELNTTYNWMGKSTASTNGWLNANHIQAFLCQGSISLCQNPIPGVTYAFARANYTGVGGATFTADGDGSGPGNSQNWSGTNYFGTSTQYWSGRGPGSSTAWNKVSDSTYDSNSWNSTAAYGSTGYTDATGSGRWYTYAEIGSYTFPLICMVHP
jgi:hypothetical protein